MQGFNKYYPPDYEPHHGSLNSYRGKHALGSRAHKIDQGILVVRFELPFNIWCGTCNNHIGMGVRYNAEKKKVGNYYSTPIFSFRCKCHLCDGYFEIETDPKNTRYVVTSGARQKNEEWDPAENGGYAIHDPEGSTSSAAADPLSSLEKTQTSLTNLKEVQLPRIESLQALSETKTSDPYTLSQKLRKTFREEKRVELKRKAEDDALKDKYGLPKEMKLDRETDETVKEAKEEWVKARAHVENEERQAKRRRMSHPHASISSMLRKSPHPKDNSVLASLRARVLENTARKPNR
ncbi:DUF572-domain-containing protein [Flagelloscypha sp. PMI_526]|nr:DUF572-domain-containing protein [Flagelloscypha sp. PMI_526]